MDIDANCKDISTNGWETLLPPATRGSIFCQSVPNKSFWHFAMKQNRVKQAKLVPISCGTGPTLAPVKVFLTLQFGFSHISFIQIYNRLAIPPLYWGRCHPVNYQLAQSRQTTGPTLRFLYSFYKLDIMHTYIYSLLYVYQILLVKYGQE